MRRTPHGLTWTAAATTAMVTASLLVSAAPAAADIAAELSYTCATDSGPAAIDLRVTSTAPARAKIGEPVVFGDVTLAMELRPGAAGDILGPPPSPSPGEPSVTGTIGLGVEVAQNGVKADAGWPAFPTRLADAPERGLALTASGTVPSVTPQAAGDITLRARALTLELAHGSAPPNPVTCTREGSGLLALTTVSGTTGIPSAPPDGSPTDATPNATPPAVPDCEPIANVDEPGGDMNPHPRLFDPDQDAPRYDEDIRRPNPAIPFCTKVAGFLNAKKLDGAAPVAGDGSLRRRARRMDLRPPENYLYDAGYFVAYTAPSTATMLGFGFLPTTATTETNHVTVAGSGGRISGNYHSHGHVDNKLPTPWGENLTFVKAFVEARVTDIAANGVPIDVGGRCTARPILLAGDAFLGNGRIGRNDLTEGFRVNSRNVTVPPFSGCEADGEDLSPLLTATVSGPGNQARLDSGPWCRLDDQATEDCDAIEREPRSFTVDPGGTLTATATPLVLTARSPSGFKIECASATWEITLKKGRWQEALEFGSLTNAEFEGCRRYGVPGDDGDGIEDNIRVSKGAFPVPIRLPRWIDETRSPELKFGGFPVIEATAADGCTLRFGAGGPRDLRQPFDITGTFVNPTNDNPASRFPVDQSISSTLGHSDECAYAVRINSKINGDFLFEPTQTITSP